METATLQGYNDFLIKSDFEFAQTFKTESGLEIHADSRFSADRLANRIVRVIAVPAKFDDCEIKAGYEVMIDPTIYYRQNYQTIGVQENPFMVDRLNGIYKIAPSMISLYRETPESDWKGYGESLLVEMGVEVVPEVKAGDLVLKQAETKKSQVYAKVTFSNPAIEADGVVKGDKIYIQKNIGVPFWIDGKEYYWINNRHVLAKIN